jgi:hypothetical protein
MSFLFTFPNPGYESLLKTEMQLFYPEWKIAFSSKGFVTFKGELPKTWPKPWFSRFSGECFGKGKALKGELSFVLKEEPWRLKGFSHQFLFADPLSIQPIELNPTAPSRAWLKMAEAHQLIKIPFVKNETVCEWGAAPGGITKYLLDLGLQVDAIEPGEMTIVSPSLNHLKMTLQKHDPRGIKYDWLVSDVNLKLDIIIDEFLKKESNFLKNLKGFFITAKIHHQHEIKKFPKYITKLSKYGFKASFQLLPSHHQEILFWGRKI